MVRNRFKRKGHAKFLLIDGYVFRSAAWKALTPNDKAVYLELKWRYDGLNNGRIGLGERELAASVGIGRDTARRSLMSLMEKGFLDKAKASGFNRKDRVATEWRLTEYPCDASGRLPTKDFMRWLDGKSTGASQVRTGASQVQLNSENDQIGADRRTSRPVVANSDHPQAHLKATYNTTTGGRADAA